MHDSIDQQSSTKHKPLNMVAIIGMFVIFLIVATFNGLAGSGAGISLGIFNNNVGNLSDMYHVDITPSGWAFSIWSLIYIWLTVTFIWYIVTIFISNSYGPVYLNPCIASPLYCLVLTLNLLLNLTWIFVWDNQLLVAASVVLILIAVTNVAQMAIVARNIAMENHALKEEQTKTYWTYVILSLNGPAIYTTWTVIASMLNLTIALRYSDMTDSNPDMITCTRISLSILLVLLIVWFVLENTVLDKTVRFIVTPYLVVIWASYAIIDNQKSQPDIPDETTDFVKSIFGIAIALFVLRIAIIIFRQIKNPIRAETRVVPGYLP